MPYRTANSVLTAGLQDAAYPGAACAIDLAGAETHIHCLGHTSHCPDWPAVSPQTIFDLASVSKVLATTTLAMLLVDAGQLDLDAPAVKHLPEFRQHNKSHLTARHLLLHNTGLPAFKPYHRSFTSAADCLAAILTEPLIYPTGTKTVYSDLGMVSFAALLERLTGRPLDALVADRIRIPLGLNVFGYNPSPDQQLRCAPTEPIEDWRAALNAARDFQFTRHTPELPDERLYIRGQVHDPTATVLGGIAGHAGIFSTLNDVLALCRMLRDAGQYNGKPFISPTTLRLFTTRAGMSSTGTSSSRALGWDTPWDENPWTGTFSRHTFAHTGYTGTSVAIDIDRGLIAILLTNRVHPTADNKKLIALRSKFHTAIIDDLAAR
jgi:CubicO group peptidase (beta-lactamase class C family)